MNYYIYKHDMKIILDALEVLHNSMKNRQHFGLPNDKTYSIDDVDSLFQSFDNSGSSSDEKHGAYHYLNLSVIMRDCKDLEDAKKKCSDLMVRYPDDNTKYMESWEIL